LPSLTISVELCAFEQLLDEMHTRIAAEGVTITREQLPVKVAAYGPGRRCSTTTGGFCERPGG